MNFVSKNVGEIFGLDRVDDALVYAGLDKDYRRDVLPPAFTDCASRIVEAWKKTNAPDAGQCEGAVEAVADTLIDVDLLRSARLAAMSRRRDNPALEGTVVAPRPGNKARRNRSPEIRDFVQLEAAKLLP